ncbi:MAG: hypothetical protein QM662_10640, partial [Gordonia sp. (in: high G+C Gram-positive bacteria)]
TGEQARPTAADTPPPAPPQVPPTRRAPVLDEPAPPEPDHGDELVADFGGGQIRALAWILVVLIAAAGAAGVGWWIGAVLI